jgi:hypothetical protein
MTSFGFFKTLLKGAAVDTMGGKRTDAGAALHLQNVAIAAIRSGTYA